MEKIRFVPKCAETPKVEVGKKLKRGRREIGSI